MILVDTSVWVDHLRSPDPDLIAALNAGKVLIHPFIIGELALGNLRHRQELLQALQELPPATVAEDAEVLALIDRQSLSGKGIGYIDAHLLASCLLTAHATLWTRDRRLQDAIKNSSKKSLLF